MAAHSSVVTPEQESDDAFRRGTPNPSLAPSPRRDVALNQRSDDRMSREASANRVMRQATTRSTHCDGHPVRAGDVQAWKRARRKEQCRVNQANYRRRKKALEVGLENELTCLRKEIGQLTAYWNELTKGDHSRRSRPLSVLADCVLTPLQRVQAIYVQLGDLPPSDNRVVEQPCAAVSATIKPLISVLDLQHEDFPGCAEFLAQWKFYKREYSVWKVTVLEYDELRVGNLAIVHANAQLTCNVDLSASPSRVELLVAPLVQRFEMLAPDWQCVRVASQVNWVLGLRHRSASLHHAAEKIRDLGGQRTPTTIWQF